MMMNRRTCSSSSYTPKRRLYMDLRSGSGFAIANLSLHKDVDHVIVRKSPSFTTSAAVSTPEEIAEIIAAQEADCVVALEAVAELVNLTKLDLVDFEGGDLPVRGLAVIFQKAKKLDVVKLDSVRISGTRDEFVDFVTALRKHPSLSELHLVGCLPTKETDMIQTMAEALSQLDSLRVVEIVETRFSPYGAWNGQSLATLCRSSSLRALRIRGVRFLRDEHIILLAQALKDNSSSSSSSSSSKLEELSLLCDIGKGAVTALCEMIAVNRSLKVLCLNRVMEGKAAHDIAQALMTNTTLQELHLYFRYCVIDHLRSCFLELMQTNYTLVKLAGGWACQQLELFLQLNQAGRKRVLAANKNDDGGGGGSNSKRRCRKNDWIELMATQKDHDVRSLSACFYLLSQNPTLCYE